MEYSESPLRQHGIRCINPAGGLALVSKQLQLSQAVVIPAGVATVVTSGQCGFKEDGSLERDPEKQIFLAFENAEKTLKAAGVTDGWKSVYQLTSYWPKFDDEFYEHLMAAKQKYMGANFSAWTGVQVPGLYDGAIIELTLYAVLPPNAN